MVVMSDKTPDEGPETTPLAQALYRVLYDNNVSFESAVVIPQLVRAVENAGYLAPSRVQALIAETIRAGYPS